MLRPVVVATLLFPPIAQAQAPREVPLGRPTASHAGEFSLLRNVRELSDGSVLVADPIDGTLQRLDRALARATALGRTGAGPGEYKQPDAVWALPADSTLLVDLGNNRLTVIAPSGTFGATRTLAEPSNGGGLTLLMPTGVDRNGRIYYRGGRPGDDSLTVMRFDRRTGQSTQVARIKGPPMNETSSGGENNRRVAQSPVPLGASDGWAVSPGGRVYIVRAGDYHVDVINADGSRVSGTRVPYTPVRIGTAEKEEFAATMRRGGALSVSMENRNGETSLALNRGRPPADAQLGSNFPPTMPPFAAGDIWVDGRERLWVRRSGAAGSAPLYDVFNERGNLIGSVRFPADRRIAGMGNGTVYVARIDEDDLMYLERYALPL
jgi:hypothetical protein